MTPEECRHLINKGGDPLEVSIQKWKDNIRTLADKHQPIYNGADNCGLCLVYLSETSDEDDCQGCPVFLHTGKIGCEGTPYDGYINVLSTKDKNIEYLLKYAIEELKFLQSLRR